MAAVNPSSVQFLQKTLGGKIRLSGTNIELNIGDGNKLTGLTCIAKHLQRTSDKFKDISLEDRMQVEQWIEYRSHIDSIQDGESISSVLQELDNYLKDKVYFVGHKLTLADVLVYHSLHNVFSKLSFRDKEQFVNVSRWFSNVQQDEQTRQSLTALPFVRSPLYAGCSGH